eukprot:Nk52_evm15s914 gene=Nk52_evmTU15s914
MGCCGSKEDTPQSDQAPQDAPATPPQSEVEFKQASILIHNLKDNERVTHRLVLVVGEIQANVEGHVYGRLLVKCYNRNKKNDSFEKEFDVHASHFKALVPVVLGTNTIEVKGFLERGLLNGSNSARSKIRCFVANEKSDSLCISRNLDIIYRRPVNTHILRAIYIVPSDVEDMRFDAPKGDTENSIEFAQKKIRFSVELMQLFMGENMRHFHPNLNLDKDNVLLDTEFINQTVKVDEIRYRERRTFRLERNEKSLLPIVHIFKSKFTLAEARKMSGGELYSAIEHQLQETVDRTQVKDVVIMSMTTLDKKMKKPLAHTALGGGGLGLFGSGNLHAWPSSIDDLYDCRLTDSRIVDSSVLFDDSRGRGTHWANFATGVGAMVHEVGHSFGGHHVLDHWCIMSRGFDYFNRFFVAQEPLSKDSHKDESELLGLVKYPDDGISLVPRYHMTNVSRFYHHPWMVEEVDDSKRALKSKICSFPSAVIEQEDNEFYISVKAENGLCQIGFSHDACILKGYFLKIEDNRAPMLVKVPLLDVIYDPIESRFKKDPIEYLDVVLTDINGLFVDVKLTLLPEMMLCEKSAKAIFSEYEEKLKIILSKCRDMYETFLPRDGIPAVNPSTLSQNSRKDRQCIHYGDMIRAKHNSTGCILHSQPMPLFSINPINARNSTPLGIKITPFGKQQVITRSPSMRVLGCDGDVQLFDYWIVCKPSKSRKKSTSLASEAKLFSPIEKQKGHPVRYGDSILLVHAKSGALLGCDNSMFSPGPFSQLEISGVALEKSREVEKSIHFEWTVFPKSEFRQSFNMSELNLAERDLFDFGNGTWKVDETFGLYCRGSLHYLHSHVWSSALTLNHNEVTGYYHQDDNGWFTVIESLSQKTSL